MTSAQILELTPESIASLESTEIPNAVTAAIQLDRDIKACIATLGLFKKRFIQEAESEFKRGGDKKQEGTTWTFADPNGEVVRVSFPERKLLTGFWLHDGKAFRFDSQAKKVVPIGNVEAAAGSCFKKLFSNSIYKPVKGFRILLGALLIPSAQKRLLEMVELPSSPRVSFGTASASASEEAPE